MKKILASLLVLALVAPAMAVDFTVTDAGDGKVKIEYTANGETLRGVALKVAVTGAEIEAGTDVVGAAFNTKIDAAYTVELATPGSYTIGAGSGLAKELEPGVLDANASVAVVSLGVLDQGGQQGGAPEGTGDVITIQLVNFAGASADICVTADDLRGGAAVGDNLAATTISDCIQVPAPGPACKGDLDGSNNISTAGDILPLINYWNTHKNFLNIATLNQAGYIEGMDIDGNGNITTSGDILPLINHWYTNKNFLNIAPCMP